MERQYCLLTTEHTMVATCTHLYSKNSESHDTVIVLLFCFLCGKLQASYQINFTSLLELASFPAITEQ